jgi:putative Ca2+/H+ antiporter (TMEM165/GDT1 family)
VRSAPTAGATGGPTHRASTDDGATAEDDLDVSLWGYDVPPALGGFLPVFVLMAVGEFGDKTQLVTITLAMTYGARPAIWVGEMAAIVPVSLLNAYLFDRFAHRFDARLVHLLAAGVFAFFAFDTFLAVVTGEVLAGPSISIWETVVTRVAEALVTGPDAMG